METSTIIKAVIAVLVILIVVSGVAYAFSKEIIPGTNELLNKIIGEKLTSEEKSGSETNFQTFNNNIEKCLQKMQKDCLCEGLPEYPGTFPKSTKLYFTTSGINTKIELKSNEGVLFKEEKQVGIVIVLLDKNGLNFNDARWKYDNTNEKWIDYSKEPPFFANKKDANDGIKLVTGQLYKSTDPNILFLIFSEDITKFNSDTLNKPICTQ